MGNDMLRRALPRLLPLSLAAALLALTPTAPATAAAPVTVRVTVTDPDGQAPSYGDVAVYSRYGDVIRNLNLGEGGQVDVTVPKGDYYLWFQIDSPSGNWSEVTSLQDLDSDGDLELTPSSHPQSLEFRNGDGTALQASGTVTCEAPVGLPGSNDSLTVRRDVVLEDGEALLQVPSWSSEPATCWTILNGPLGGLIPRRWAAGLSSFSTTVAPSADLTINVEDGLPAPPPTGRPNGNAVIRSAAHAVEVNRNLISGAHSTRVEQGTWDLRYSSSGSGVVHTGTSRVEVEGDLVKTLALAPHPLTVDVQDAGGAPLTATTVRVECTAPTSGGTRSLSIETSETSNATLWGLNSGSAAPACQVLATAPGNPTRVVAANATSPAGNSVTVRFPATGPVGARCPAAPA